MTKRTLKTHPAPRARDGHLGSGLGPNFLPGVEVAALIDLKRQGIKNPSMDDVDRAAQKIVEETWGEIHDLD